LEIRQGYTTMHGQPVIKIISEQSPHGAVNSVHLLKPLSLQFVQQNSDRESAALYIAVERQPD